MTDLTSDGILPNVIQSNTAQSDCKRGPMPDYIACFGVTEWRRTLTLIVRWLA